MILSEFESILHHLSNELSHVLERAYESAVREHLLRPVLKVILPHFLQANLFRHSTEVFLSAILQSFFLEDIAFEERLFSLVEHFVEFI